MPIHDERQSAYTTPRSDVGDLVPKDAKRILDLGCSDGSLGQYLKHGRPDRWVQGVEYSAELAQRAASRLDAVLRTDLNDPARLSDLPQRHFDCVIAADVLEHLVNPDRLLTALLPLLVPNATMVVSLPNIRHHSAMWSIYFQGRFPRRARGIFDDTHLRWFTLRDARNMMEEAGFTIEATDYALRFGDQGGGLANRLANRWLVPTANWCTPVREFLTYQFLMRTRLRGT